MTKENIIWAEISLKAIKNNITAIKKILNPNVEIMAVVKADAYGHGATKVAKEALKNGVKYLSVARIEEAIALRKEGIKAPILIFSYTHKNYFKELIKYSLTQTLFSLEYAKELSHFASSLKQELKVHINVDTGMGRCGFLVDSFRTYEKNELLKDIKSVCNLKNIFVEGIYTHFACADEKNKKNANKQLKEFSDILKNLKKAKINIPIKHASNSAATIDMPDTHFDMIRIGISLYGLYPSYEVDKKKVKLLPAMSLKAYVIMVRKVPKNFQVSYGSTFKTKKASVLATLPIGYADGFNRLLSSKGVVLINGEKACIVGRVCMDHIVVDVSHIANVKVGDEAVIFGTQKKETISVDEIAKSLNTINYEVVSTLSNRVRRVYK